MPWVSGGNITGTTGRKLRIEGININLSQDTVHSLTGTIMYRTHVQDIGWTGWKTLGQYSGTSGRAKQVEAIEIKLTGQLATFYNIYYSSHIECKLRSNGMPVPLLRNGYSIFNGTKYR